MAKVRSQVPTFMDKDSDPSKIRDGRFQDGQNIRLVSELGNTGFSVETIQGNTYQFTLPSVASSNKQYRLTLGGLPATHDITYAYNIYDSAGSLIGYKIRSAINLSYPSWKAVMMSDISAIVAGVTFTNGSVNDKYLYVSFNSAVDDIMTLHNTNSYTNSLEITQTNEARDGNDTDLVGELRTIGGKEVADVLFVFSTVCQSSIGGTGQIGVVQYDAQSNSYNYTNLLTTKEFLWTTLKQIDCDGEHESTYHLYFEDDFNYGRCWYYKGIFQTNGSVTNQGTTVHADGIYTYGSIAQEMRLQALAMNMTCVFASQSQGGGSLLAGNKRYTVRALTETLNATPFISLTNDIPVFSASTQASADLLMGDLSGTPTGKSNTLTVSGLDSDLFKYVELAVVEYYGTSQQVSIVSRTLITSGTMTLTHSGNETTTQLTFAELQEQIVAYKTAKNVRIVDRRLIRSNVNVEPDIDFDTSAIIGETKIKNLPSAGNYNSLVLGEYQDPENVNNYVGYQDFETYKFAIKVNFTSGKYLVYPIADWLCEPVLNNPDAGTIGYNLTDSGDIPDIRVRYAYLSNIDMSIFGDEWSSFEIVRADLIPEILHTGVIVMMQEAGGSSGIMQPSTGAITPYITFNNDQKYGGILYSPDVFLGKSPINTLQSGDELRVFGNPQKVEKILISQPPASAKANSTFIQFNGYTALTTYHSQTLTSVNNVGFDGSVGVVLNGTAYTYNNRSVFLIPGNHLGQKGIVVTSTSTIRDAITGNPDYGLYYYTYIRPQTNKYGDGVNISYGSTGHYQERIVGQTIYTASVYGGDTFIQNTYFHNLYAESFGNSDFGFAMSFYSQNKANSQLRYVSDLQTGYVFPSGMGAFQSTSITERLAIWMQDINSEQLNYDQAYSIRNGAQLFPSFDPNADPPTEFPARFPYSLQKPVGATKDFYRVFLPLDVYDEEISDGEVLHMENLNGNLYSWQPKGMKRQYVSATTTQQGSDGIDIVLGLANAFGTRGTKLTQYGTNHKWAVLKGKNQTGDDIVSWITTDYKKALKFGGSGVEVISDTKFMKSFFENNLQWVMPYDRPAHDFGINGVFDVKNMEFTWTVLAMRQNAGEWDSGRQYVVGEVVYYTPSNRPNYGVQYRLYICILNDGTTDNNPLMTLGTYWDAILPTDNNYINQYTIVYSEYKGGFTTFLSPMPLIYLPYKSTYFTPKPTYSDFNEVFSNGGGDYLTWYDDGSGFMVLTDDASVVLVFNIEDFAYKAFYDNVITAIGKPDEMRYYTQDNETFTLAVDIEERNNQFVSPIRNDILTSSNGNTPTEDTSRMKGKWLYCKWVAYAGMYKRLKDVIVDYRTISRI